MSELTVCFWNILNGSEESRSVKSQTDRLDDIVKDLEQFQGDSITGISEVSGSNGHLIAERLGYDTKHLVEYHSANNYIGLISKLNLSPMSVQLEKKCRAVMTDYEGITIVVVHLTWGVLVEALHKRQLRTLLSHLDTNKPTVIMGDFNSQARQPSRKMLVKAGFRSALGRSIFKRIPTAPAKKYRHMYPEPFKTLGLYGFTLDDIYTRGMKVQDSGTFEGESDHLGVWAKLQKN